MAVRRHPAVGPTGATGATGLTGATGATGPAGTAPAGVPVLRGPYVVDYTDIPHDGDSMTLWTPAVGDVLLAIWSEPTVHIAGQQGGLYFNNGSITLGTVADPNPFAVADFPVNNLYRGGGGSSYAPDAVPYIFTTADPLMLGYAALGDADLTAGHCALYALVARAVAP